MTDDVAVGIDGTLASRFAVDWAMHLAERTSTNLRLVHVAARSGRSTSETDELILKEMEFARSLPVSIVPTVEILEGDVVRGLAGISTTVGTLVIGTHKTGFLRGRAFGSTGPRLAAVVRSPLAVIPAPSGRSRHGFVTGIDDDIRGLPAIRMAARDAVAMGVELTILHVNAAGEHSELAAALKLLDVEFPDLPIRTRAVLGAPAEVLINASAGAECLYIGGGDGHGYLGPVGHDVLLNISGPTMLVPLAPQPA